MKPSPFERTAGAAALIAALAGFGYSLSLVALNSESVSALFLMASGLLSTLALVAFFTRLGEADRGAALFGGLLGVFGALGSVIHGGYNLGNGINPPGELGRVGTLPNQLDPRGLLTFAFVGLALLIAGFLMLRDARFGRGFTALTFVLASVLIVVYVIRLIEPDPTPQLLQIPAAVTGLIISPLWYIVLGLALRGAPAQAAAGPLAPRQ